MLPTQRLIALARRAEPSNLPLSALTVAKHCILDWLGVTLAGAREPAARILFEHAVRSDTATECSLLGFATHGSALSAALLHGTAAHALDFDDTHWGLQGHPTVPVLSALFGLAQREHASGAALLAALVAGVEVECRLGEWLNPDHYARGFHATGTLGTFGAAAGAAHLLGLDAPAFTYALGLAGSQAAGLKSAFGSMAKPLQAGRAAHAGLLSALLARGGFTAADAIVEADQGFAATHARPRLPAPDAPLPGDFAILETLFKYHAACHLTHATLDGLRAVLHERSANDIEAVELALDETCFGVCAIERPRSGLQLKFSLKGCAALALLGAATEDPRTFDDARAGSAELEHWRARITLRQSKMPATRTELRVQLRDGEVVTATHDSGVPERDLARQEERLRRKFDRLAPLPPAIRSAVCDRVLSLEREPNLDSLLALLQESAG